MLGRTVYAATSGRCNVEVHYWSKLWTCGAWLKTSLSCEETPEAQKEQKDTPIFQPISHLLPSKRTPDTITVDSIGKVVSNFNIYNMIMWKECFPASDQHILVRDRM